MHSLTRSLFVLFMLVGSMSSSAASFAAATTCAASTRTSSGHHLCPLCHARVLVNPKHSRPWGEHRVHISCWKTGRAAGVRAPAWTVAAETDATPAAATLAAAASTAAAPSMLSPAVEVSALQLQLRYDRLHFDTYGYARVAGTPRSKKLAWLLDELRLQKRQGEVISGEVKQLHLRTALSSQQESLQEEWHALVKETASMLGVSGANGLHVVDSKILVAAPGRGAQPVHWDTARELAAAEKYSCILFVSNGCHSTALPRFPSNDTLSFCDDPTGMQSVAHLLHPSQYESREVFPGDMVFFRQSTPHYGVANTKRQGDRVVLFGILSSSSEPEQDALQVFPWLYIADAYGWKSKQLAECLVQNKEHQPLELFLGDSTPARNSAIACLRQHDLLNSYNPIPTFIL